MVHRTLVWKLVNLALPCVILLFSASPLGAAFNPPSNPELSITPSSGTPGSMVTIEGKGFTPSSSMKLYTAALYVCSVTITMDTIVVATNVKVDSDGTFSTTAAVPDLPLGTKTVTAVACDESASTSFTVIMMITPMPILLKPDLIIFSTNYRFEAGGRVLTLSIGIMNQGWGKPSETLVSIRDKDQDFPYSTRPVPSLIHGETATVDTQYELVKAQCGKTHAFVFEVDPDNAVDEADEDNNHQSMNVLIPKQGGEVPWHWIVPALLAGGVAVSVERLINRRRLNLLKKIQVRPQRDIGTQQIESDSPILLDYEIRLRPVLDRGKQDIEAKGPLIIDKRRRG